MSGENNTKILLKLLYSQSESGKIGKNGKKRKRKRMRALRRAFPSGVEYKMKNFLASAFKPLVDYVKNYFDAHIQSVVRGDLRADAMPGGEFKRMFDSLNVWVSTYAPSELDGAEMQDNAIMIGLNDISESALAFEEKQLARQLEQGLGVKFNVQEQWWAGVKENWAAENYSLISSNARKYVADINRIVERGVISGMSVSQISAAVALTSTALTKTKCALIARDQIGKLQARITQAQMTEIGLEMYVWSASGDERVRESHRLMDGLLCRWDDASVCSDDGGGTWKDRPSGAVRLHPGEDIQCRCVALAYEAELLQEIAGE